MPLDIFVIFCDLLAHSFGLLAATLLTYSDDEMSLGGNRNVGMIERHRPWMCMSNLLNPCGENINP